MANGKYLWKGIEIVRNSNKSLRRKRCWFFRIVTGFFKVIIALLLLFVLVVGGINLDMIIGGSGRILTQEEATELTDVDYILVLGASVRGTEPSPMLRDRLDVGNSLYEAGVSDTLLMSGDGSDRYYNEVNTMKLYSMNAGVPETQIEEDPLGLCTYDSIRRVIDEYAAAKIVIVTQRYHRYRALYIARRLGVEAYGVTSDARHYSDQTSREIREIAARCKDFFMVWLGECSGDTIEKLTDRIEQLSARY